MVQLSVIIPTYNNAPYLERCISSLLPIDSSMQIIVVDDGSTDNTQQVLTAIKNRIPQIEIICQSNLGVSSARNAGIKKATGRFVLFVDADDCLFSNVVQALVRKCEYCESDVIVMRSFREDAELYKWSHLFCEDNVYYGVDLMKSGYIRGSVCGCAFRTHFLRDNRVSFIEDLTIAEDTVFFACVLSAGASVSFADIKLYDVVPRQGSASRNYSPAFLSRYSNAIYALRSRVENRCIADNTLLSLLLGIVNIAVKIKVSPLETAKLCAVQKVLPLSTAVFYRQKWFVIILNYCFPLFYGIKKWKDKLFGS